MTIYNMAINATINTKPGLKKLKTKYFPFNLLVSCEGNLFGLSQADGGDSLKSPLGLSVWGGVNQNVSKTVDTVVFDTGSASIKGTNIDSVTQGLCITSMPLMSPVKPNKEYKVILRLKSDAVGRTVSFNVYGYRINNSYLTDWAYHEFELPITDSEFHSYVFSFTTPNDGTLKKIRVDAQGDYFPTGCSLWWDSGVLKEVTSDGSGNILRLTVLKQISTKITSKLSFERFLTIGLETSQTLKARMNILRGKTLYGLVCIDVKESLLVLKRLQLNLKGLTTEHTLNLRTLKAGTAMNATVDIYQYFLKKFYQVKIQTSKHYKTSIRKFKQFKVKVEGRLK